MRESQHTDLRAEPAADWLYYIVRLSHIVRHIMYDMTLRGKIKGFFSVDEYVLIPKRTTPCFVRLNVSSQDSLRANRYEGRNNSTFSQDDSEVVRRRTRLARDKLREAEACKFKIHVRTPTQKIYRR